MIKFNAQLVTLDASADESQPSRTITGLAVPWDVVANLSNDIGPVKFLKGSISVDGPMPKLLEYHDDTRVIGRVTERLSTDDGLMFVATLSKTRAADDAMALLADGSISAVSIGAVPIKFKRVDGVMEVSEARMIELSLVSFPAYADAEIQSVYAAAAVSDESLNNFSNAIREALDKLVSESTDEDEESDEEIPEEETPPQPSEEDEMSNPTSVDAAIATRPIYATLKKEVKIPTAVEYLAAAIAGGDKWKAFHEVLKAAAPDVDLASGPGVLPELIVAPVYNNFQGLRPVVDAVGVRSMPAAGSTFIRPKVTTHNSMGVQTNDLDTLTASTMVVSSETVTKGTYGGYVSISEQLLDWSEPSMLTVLLDDMARIYANTTDNVAADALVAGATTTGAFGDPTVPADWLAWIGASSTTILTASNGNNPNTLFCSADVFGDLIALSDTAGRPLFPNLNAQNAMGAVAVTSDVGTAFGCRVVRDRNFAANTLILGDSSGFEIFESQKGAISVDVPSTLSRTIAFRGYFATLMIDLDKFVKASSY